LGGALIALVIVAIFVVSLASVLREVMLLYHMPYEAFNYSCYDIGFFVISAICLGLIGAYLSVKRQLALIEP